MKKKILVMYARYGSGHKSIAEYVANYIEGHNKNVEVLLLDMTDYANLLGRVTVKIMDFVGKYRPEFIFNACWELVNHKITSLGFNTFVKKSYDNEDLKKVIEEFNPDITISSHYYCSSIIAYYNNKKIINSKLLSIITDYCVHEWHIRNHKYEDGFIVGNEIIKQQLINKGIDARKVYAFGLPLNIGELKKLDAEETILKRYNLAKGKKVYLFFGGSSTGSMYYYDYFKAIAKMNLEAEIIFVSGKNVKLKNKCEKYVKEKKIQNIKVLGYTNDVFNLMKISDLVISKPGGATVTECLEMKVPMVLVPGVGGQEKYNARFMAKKKYGIKVRGLWSFKRCLERLENNPIIIKKIQERMLKNDNNKSVVQINNLINKW